MTEFQQEALKTNALIVGCKISNESTVGIDQGLVRRLSYQNPPHRNSEILNYQPLQFGNTPNPLSSLLKQNSVETGLPPMPGAKTPREKQRICFGTPLQRPESKHSL